MKKIILATMLGALAAFWAPAQAANSNSTFNVSITLNSACTFDSMPSASFTYTAFGSAATLSSTAGSVRCTNGLAISSVRLDDGTGTAGAQAASDTQSYTDQATNLQYSLTVTGPGVGTGSAQALSLTGTMASGQAGNCTTASCTNTSSTNKTRTVYINY